MGEEFDEPTIGLAVTPLVGRQAELTALDRALEHAAGGSFGMTLLVGDPGLGKSRLAGELLHRHGGEAVGLTARAHAFGAMSSFGVWAEALDGRLRDRSEADLARLCGASLPDLATMLRHVAAAFPPPSGHAPDRLRILAGFAELLGNLTEEGPVVVSLDDLHLADASSWGALPYLARHLATRPLLVVATARPAELDRSPVAGEVLSGLAQDGVLQRITLRPLEAEAVRELAGHVVRADGRGDADVPATLVKWLLDRSRGHPLFVLGLLRALLSAGADLASPDLEGVPASLRDRVRADLAGLDADARDLLDLLAVEDRRVEVDELVDTSGLGLEELGGGLTQLTRARLVTEHEAGTRLQYEIAHPLVQRIVYDDMGGAVRRGRHRHVARALVAAGRLGAAASHFARAAQQGDGEAITMLCKALEQADDQGLYQEALLILDALLELLPQGDPRWLDVLDAMTGRAEWVVGHLVEGDAGTAIAAMRRIEALLEDTDDVDRRALVQFQLASFLGFGAGRLEEARRACLRAIDLFEDAGRSDDMLLAKNELAWIEGASGDLAGQARLARSVAAAEGAPSVKVQALSTLGYAQAFRGEVDEAERVLRESGSLARSEGNLYRWAWSRTQLAMPLTFAGRLEEATATVEQALAGHPAAADAIAYEVLAHCHWLAGRLPEALAAIQQSQARRPVSGSRRRAWGSALAARVAAEAGDCERSEHYLSQAEAIYGRSEFLVWACWREWTAGVLSWQRGDPAAALPEFWRAARWLRDMDAITHEGLLLADLVEVAATSGDADTAQEAHARLRSIASRIGGHLFPALVDTAAVWVGRVDGKGSRDHDGKQADEPDATLAAGEHAVEQLERHGYRLHSAVALDALARAEAATGGRRAVEAHERAARALEACGAQWRRDQLLQRLSGLGARGRRAAGALLGKEALTEREREIVRLAARGYTAQQIGRRLFIGTRTVETHLANAYPKLGVRSKRELVQRADELGV